MVNIDRKQVDYDTYQIRYDSNNELKDFLRGKFTTSYKYLKSKRDNEEEYSRKQHALPEDMSEYMEFYETEEPFKYEVKLITADSSNRSVKIWWVNQGKTQELEKEKGVIWAPLKGKNDNAIYHWETLKEVEIDDLILHYSNGALRYISKVLTTAVESSRPEGLKINDNWDVMGRLIEVEYYELEPEIKLNKFNNQIKDLDINKGPINIKGEVNQGYLFNFNKVGLKIIQQSQTETDWPEFALLDNEIYNEDILIDIQDIIKNIINYIESRGFTYPPGLIENFYLSLKTKPFVLLAGVSGTGKTKLVKLFAEALACTESNGRFKLISVRPDWSDSSDLLGYKDIKGKFQPGPMIDILKKAKADPENIYFVCLDEMNLARVEYYFSDFLSIMETRRKNGEGGIATSYLLEAEDFARDEDKKEYAELMIPDNLYLVGTVNMDETTHPFSKKVLDRANTIEFSEINLLDYKLSDPINNSEIVTTRVPNQFLRADYLTLNNCSSANEEIIKEVVEKLQKINKILERASLQVGYRVRDEFCFYMIYNKQEGLLDKEQAFDFQLMQKILPRIQGSSRSIKNVLIQLFKFVTSKDLSNDEGQVGNEAVKIIEEYHDNREDQNIIYPISAEKIATMLKRIEEDGFTAYWL